MGSKRTCAARARLPLAISGSMRHSSNTSDASGLEVRTGGEYLAATQRRRRIARFVVPLLFAAVVAAVMIVILDAHRSAGAHPRASSPAHVHARHVRAFWTVRPGNTLAQIAAQTGLTLNRLEVLNPDVDPNGLLPGERLKLVGIPRRRPRPGPAVGPALLDRPAGSIIRFDRRRHRDQPDHAARPSRACGRRRCNPETGSSSVREHRWANCCGARGAPRSRLCGARRLEAAQRPRAAEPTRRRPPRAGSSDRRQSIRGSTAKLPSMDLQLADKVAVVTGASKGIGLAVTQALADEGALVVAGARTIDALEGLPGVTRWRSTWSTPKGPGGSSPTRSSVMAGSTSS